jgi:molybdopterin synthase catalytic subunit
VFELTDQVIEVGALRAALSDPRAGALASFEGVVRNTHQGRVVVALDYEAYRELAVSEGERICADIRARHELLGLVVVHRVGHLAVGEVAVWVGALAGHRDAAFAACRAAIDEIKRRVPIWKQEHYVDGVSAWLHPEQ